MRLHIDCSSYLLLASFETLNDSRSDFLQVDLGLTINFITTFGSFFHKPDRVKLNFLALLKLKCFNYFCF